MAKLNFIIICDDAEISKQDGKLNIRGVFDSIYSKSYPALHPLLAIVIHIEVQAGNHIQTIRFTRDGQEILPPFEKSFVTEKPRHQFIHRIKDFPLQTAGKYEARVFVDNEFLGSNYFWAKIEDSNL